MIIKEFKLQTVLKKGSIKLVVYSLTKPNVFVLGEKYVGTLQPTFSQIKSSRNKIKIS